MNIFGFMHLILVIFIILTPFITNRPSILCLHLTVLFGIIIHWCTNSNVCCLTTLESYFYNTNPNETFFGKLVGPVYDMSDKQVRILTYIFFILSTVNVIYLFKTSQLSFKDWIILQ